MAILLATNIHKNNGSQLHLDTNLYNGDNLYIGLVIKGDNTDTDYIDMTPDQMSEVGRKLQVLSKELKEFHVKRLIDPSIELPEKFKQLKF